MKKRTLTDILYDYALYFIIGILLLVIIAMEPSFVRLSNVTTILTQSATKIEELDNRLRRGGDYCSGRNGSGAGA